MSTSVPQNLVTPSGFLAHAESLAATAGPAAHFIPHQVPYAATPETMEQTQLLRREGLIADTAVYLEHEPVVTFGRETPDAHLASVPQYIPTVPVPRGGLATYHGPGQMVGYLFLDLTRRADSRPPDLHAYLRAIEDGLIAFLQAEFGLPACLRPGFTGVWTYGYLPKTRFVVPPSGGRGSEPNGETTNDPNLNASHFSQEPPPCSSPQPLPPEGGTTNLVPRKLASIGVSCRRWVTAHGFALNIHPDMAGFRAIVPCGITDAEMTSVQRECELAGRNFEPKSMKELASRLHPYLAQSFADAGWCRAQNQEV